MFVNQSLTAKSHFLPIIYIHVASFVLSSAQREHHVKHHVHVHVRDLPMDAYDQSDSSEY